MTLNAAILKVSMKPLLTNVLTINMNGTSNVVIYANHKVMRFTTKSGVLAVSYCTNKKQ